MQDNFYTKNLYPDGSFYVTISDFPSEFTFFINSYEDLWLLNQINDVYKHNRKNATVTIPFLLDSQADRRFESNQSSGLKLVCSFINKMGWEKVKVFHPHNPEVVEALIDNVQIIGNSKFINNVLSKIGKEKYPELTSQANLFGHLPREVVLMSTDAGGFKPLMKLCDKINWHGETFSASKSRSYVDGKSKLIQSIDKDDFQGKDILIIDDLCVYGGTFIGLAKMLKSRNVGKLYLAVSHITVENPNSELFEVYDKVFTTNSKSYRTLMTLPTSLEIINMFV